MNMLKIITLTLLSLTLFGMQPVEARGFGNHGGQHHSHGHRSGHLGHRQQYNHGHRRGRFSHGHSGRHYKPYRRPYTYYRRNRIYNYPNYGYGIGLNRYYYNRYSYPSYRYYGGSGYYR